MLLTPLQQNAVAIVPHVSAPLSVIGSTFILYLMQTKRVENSRTYSRLMLGLCTYDLLASSWTMLGSLPVVKGVGDRGKGNVQTCTAQGFFLYLGSMGTLAFNCCLLLYYLLVIRFKWTEDKVLKLEPYMHAYAFAVPLIQNGVGLVLKIYNPAPYAHRCGITPYPSVCAVNPQVACERGGKINFYITYFFVLPSMVSLGFLLVSILGICSSVRFEARQATRIYQYNSTRGATHAVVQQSIIYAVVFINTYVWVFLRYFLRRATNQRLLYAVRFLSELMLPLQGFFNFLIFIRPRYKKIRHSFPRASFFFVIKETLFGTRHLVGRRRSRSAMFRQSFGCEKRQASASSFNIGIASSGALEVVSAASQAANRTRDPCHMNQAGMLLEMDDSIVQEDHEDKSNDSLHLRPSISSLPLPKSEDTSLELSETKEDRAFHVATNASCQHHAASELSEDSRASSPSDDPVQRKHNDAPSVTSEWIEEDTDTVTA